MSKRNLKAVADTHGTFTRTTETAYTHVVVRIPVKRFGREVYASAADFATRNAVCRDGVYGRIVKDRGYVVTWHKSERTARDAAAKPNKWFEESTLVGVFPVAQ